MDAIELEVLRAMFGKDRFRLLGRCHDVLGLAAFPIGDRSNRHGISPVLRCGQIDAEECYAARRFRRASRQPYVALSDRTLILCFRSRKHFGDLNLALEMPQVPVKPAAFTAVRR
jgi:hypothetical protein